MIFFSFPFLSLLHYASNQPPKPNCDITNRRIIRDKKRRRNFFFFFLRTILLIECIKKLNKLVKRYYSLHHFETSTFFKSQIETSMVFVNESEKFQRITFKRQKYRYRFEYKSTNKTIKTFLQADDKCSLYETLLGERYAITRV